MLASNNDIRDVSGSLLSLKEKLHLASFSL